MDLGFRNRVAEAVHRAVCKITSSDGFAKCHLYSLAGVGLLSRLTNRYYVPQAGSILISAGEPDRWVGIDISLSGDSLVGLSDGDYHCWIADATDCSVGCDITPTLIDLSSRHYHRMVALRQGKADAVIRQLSQLEQMPYPLWTDCGFLPTWLKLIPDAAATDAVYGDLTDRIGTYGPLLCEAERQYRDLFEREKLRLQSRALRRSRKVQRQRRKQSRRVR